MKQFVTTGIILNRLDYGEADRILTVLTPDHGKLSLLAKGVRRVKSKLAGGIELFSVSNITFIKGRGSLDSLVSTRLIKHYGHIVKDLDRTMAGYEFMKQLNRATEDQTEPEYFTLAEQIFSAFNDQTLAVETITFWFAAQLLHIAGHAPNLQTDTTGAKLDIAQHYNFDFDRMAFAMHDAGRFTADHIKYFRLGLSQSSPKVLQQVQGGKQLTTDMLPLIRTMLQTFSLL